MPVIINRSDGTALTTLEDAELDTNSSSIALFGIGGSGEDLIDKINENFVHIVENFASAVPPVSPQRGQLWYQLVNDYGGLIGPPLDYEGVGNPGSPEPAKSQLMIYNGVKWETLLDHYGTKLQDKLDELEEDYGTGVAGPGNDYLINPEIQLLYDRLEEFQTRYDALIESGFAKLDDLGAQVDRTLSESTQGVYDGIDRLDLAVTNGQEALNTGLATLDGLINGEGGLRDDVNDLYDQISLVDPAFGTPGRRIIELEEISNTSVTRISAMESVVGLTPSQGLRSRISNLEQTVTDGGVATATRVDALETVVFNPETGVVNLGSRLLQSEETIADLPNQYASTTRVGLLESFVNDPVTGNEQLGARISSAEQTITDLPNNYASTTRVSNLESTVNAANGGNANLLSRISSVETTFANGTYATSTRVGQLESRVGLTDGSGLSARILSAETTLVDIPNNYASTTRVTNLESTVNAGTGGVLDLRARVGSIETTFANGVYAEASRVTALESIVGTGEGGDNLVARIGTVESTVANINQNYATSTRVSTIETLVNNPTTGVTNLGSRIGSVETTIVNLPTNYTSAARGTALESLVNAGTGGILNLRSRLGTTESTIADLPNQYTSASRGSFLESQVGLTANAAGSLRARVGTIETTFANNVYATSTRVATLESRVGLTDGVGLSARIVSAETTIANLPANYASASRVTTLEARSRSLPNLIKNSDFVRGTQNWGKDNGSTFSTYYHPVLGTLANIGGATTYAYTDNYPVNAGDPLSASLEGDNPAGSFYIQWLPSYTNSAAANISTSGWGSRAVLENVVAPSGTTAFRVIINRGSASSLNWTRVKVNYGSVATNWSTENEDFNNNARIIAVENVTTNGTFASASRASTLEAQMAGTQSSNLLGRIQTVENVTTNGTFATASRASALEAQFAGTQGSNLLSRIQTVENVTTNGAFATASRASTLEAQLNGTTSSNLLSRIGSLETVTSNGSLATASSVNSISARLNNGGDINAAINNTYAVAVDAQGKANAQATLLLNANGKITGYNINNNGQTTTFDIQADRFRISDGAGTNLAPFRVEGGVTIMQNARVDGNLVVNGTLNGEKIANDALTGVVAAYNAGLINLNNNSPTRLHGAWIGVQKAGSPIDINFNSWATFTHNASGSFSAIVQLVRSRGETGGDVIQTVQINGSGMSNDTWQGPIPVMFIDNPGATGNWHYYVQIYFTVGNMSTQSVTARYCKLTELKNNVISLGQGTGTGGGTGTGYSGGGGGGGGVYDPGYDPGGGGYEQ